MRKGKCVLKWTSKITLSDTEYTSLFQICISLFLLSNLFHQITTQPKQNHLDTEVTISRNHTLISPIPLN